jgi:hypothetical protein
MKQRALMIVLALLAASPAAHANPRFGASDIHTLFVIAKSDDRNEVHYGIHLAADCTPVGDEPIFAYWQQVEKGPNVVEDLNFLDRTVYGVKNQSVTKRAPDESKVLMTLKASDRVVAIIVKKRDGRCVSDAIATIAGQPGHLDRVFVHVAGLFRVDWLEIRGSSGGKPVVERVNR